MSDVRHRPSGHEISMRAASRVSAAAEGSSSAPADEMAEMADRSVDSAISLSGAWRMSDNVTRRRLRALFLRVLAPFTSRQMRLDDAITDGIIAMREKQAEADDRLRALEERVLELECHVDR